MKNYCLNDSAAALFILNYEVDGNNIIINFADKKSSTIPYSLEAEKKILEKMKKQVLNSRKFEEDQKDFISSAIKFYVIDGALFAGNVFILLNNITNSPSTNKVLMGICALAILLNTYLFANSKIKLDDLNKNKLFLENEEMFNARSINLNSIDKMNYKQFKEVFEIIKEDELEQLNNALEKTKVLLK